jgi:glycosyltransferase involved in cell wall biosynthesis
MISLIIPTYRNPEYLDICLKSAIENQSTKNQIIVAVDGFIEESQHILDKYENDIQVLDLGENQGMQTALNLAVYNATNEFLVIINDDNVLSKDWDKLILDKAQDGFIFTINQIEPTGPGIFNFPVNNLGKHPRDFKYEEFLQYELTLRKDNLTLDGGIFPFVISKKDYMVVGGFDTMYQSPFICDWDFFLKLELYGMKFYRMNNLHFYHFGSAATKNGKEGDKFKQTEHPAAQMFMYKWGMTPQLLENNSHRPKGYNIKGINF